MPFGGAHMNNTPTENIDERDLLIVKRPERAWSSANVCTSVLLRSGRTGIYIPASAGVNGKEDVNIPRFSPLGLSRPHE